MFCQETLGMPHHSVFNSTNMYTKGLLCHSMVCPMPTLFKFAGHEQMSFCSFLGRRVCGASNAAVDTSCYNIGEYCNPRVNHSGFIRSKTKVNESHILKVRDGREYNNQSRSSCALCLDTTCLGLPDTRGVCSAPSHSCNHYKPPVFWTYFFFLLVLILARVSALTFLP